VRTLADFSPAAPIVDDATLAAACSSESSASAITDPTTGHTITEAERIQQMVTLALTAEQVGRRSRPAST
jgi:hypothetical protein